MAAKKKASSRKPREMNPPKEKYVVETQTNMNVPGARWKQGTHWASKTVSSQGNVPTRWSWPKGGGVYSSPAPEMTKAQKASYNQAVNAQLRAENPPRPGLAEMRKNKAAKAESKRKNGGRKPKGAR